MSNREEWLTRAAGHLGTMIETASSLTVPPTRVSVGWPGGKRSALGECWKPTVTRDGLSHIFITPTVDEGPRALDILLHELCHATVNMHYPEAEGHGSQFGRLARGVGLEGKLTATVAGEELALTLADLVSDELGTYPHAAIEPPMKPKVQTTRMHKVVCQNRQCRTFDFETNVGYTLRTTAKWLDSFGTPICVCGERMEEE